MEKSTQLGMLNPERGMISLTLDGAKKVKESGQYWVKIFDDFSLVGSVFSPGIADADRNIRCGDEVVVIQQNKLCGVGVAMMNGRDMAELHYGEAVKIRHRC